MHHFSTKDTNTRLYVLRKHALIKKALQGAQSMLDAGCAALLQNEYKLIEHQAKLQRCAVQLCPSPRNARSISAQLVDSRGLLHHPWDGKA